MGQDTPDNRWKIPFFTIWTGQAFSLLGSQLVGFALIWYLTEATGSATVLATATTIKLLPTIILGPFAGTFIDRWPRKWVLILSDAAIAALTAMMGLLFAMGVAQPWHVMAILFLRAVGDVFQNPAMQVTTATMVPRDWLPRVSGMNSTLDGALRFVAPGLGALLLATTDMALILALDVITALLAVAPLFFIALPQCTPSTAAQRRNMWQDMGDAAQYMWHHRGLRVLVASAAVFGVLFMPAHLAFRPLLVTQHFGGGVQELALVESVSGIASIVGGVLLSAWGGFKRQMATSLVGTFALAMVCTIIGLLPGNAFVVAVVAFGLSGIAGPMHMTVIAVFQGVVPPELQGRFFSFLRSVLNLASPVSLMIAGPIADRIGVQPFYLIAGLGALIIVCWRRFTPKAYLIEDTVVATAPAAADD